jgi:hypothetical protein
MVTDLSLKISYHAIDADLPNWAIIFGGDLYMVLFLHHTKDSDDENRVAIVCSDILSIYHNGPGIYPFNRLSDENILSLYQEDQASAATYTTELPLCSAVLYMLMTSLGDGDGLTNSKSLEEKLKISIKKPVALGLGLGRRCAGGKTSTDTTLVSPP